jgi:hypothetical protein
MGEITDELGAVLGHPILRWPNVFNAVQPPRLHATAADFRPEENSGGLEADVSDYPGGVATEVDHDRIDETGFAFSKRFLESWLYAASPPRSETTRRTAREFAAEFGIELGDPSDVPEPEDSDVPLEVIERGHVRPPAGWGCRDPPTPPCRRPASSYAPHEQVRTSCYRLPDPSDPTQRKFCSVIGFR